MNISIVAPIGGGAQSVKHRREKDMPIASKYMFIVSMDVTKEKEALFNEVYDTEHVPLLLKVPGVRAVTRLKTEPAAVMIGGARKPLEGDGAPSYVALYELDSPDVLLSREWAEAVEKGRWPDEVRPFTSNRRHIVRKVI
jgi:hypothetical protein